MLDKLKRTLQEPNGKSKLAKVMMKASQTSISNQVPSQLPLVIQSDRTNGVEY